MADKQTLELSSEHPIGVTTVTRDEMLAALRYLQPAAGSSFSAMVAAWADAAAGVIAKTGVNTSESIGYESLRQRLENNAAYQTITGNDTINVTSHVTYLSATSGSYALQINVGSYDGQEKIVCLVDNVTTAEFVLTAGFLDWNTLTFRQGNRCVILRWVGGSVNRWVMVGGNAEGA